jgi:hypothetical protein
MPPTCTHAPSSYPRNCLERALKSPSVARSVPRDATDVELELQREYIDMVNQANITNVADGV